MTEPDERTLLSPCRAETPWVVSNAVVEAPFLAGVRDTPQSSLENQESRAEPAQFLRSAPAGVRTPNLLIRSQVLYPIELRARGRAFYSRAPALQAAWSVIAASDSLAR